MTHENYDIQISVSIQFLGLPLTHLFHVLSVLLSHDNSRGGEEIWDNIWPTEIFTIWAFSGKPMDFCFTALVPTPRCAAGTFTRQWGSNQFARRTIQPSKEGKSRRGRLVASSLYLSLPGSMFTSWKMSLLSPLPRLCHLQLHGRWLEAKPTPCCVTLHLRTGIKEWPTGMLGYQSRGNWRCSGGIKRGCTRFDVSKQLKGHVNNFNRDLETTEKSLTWQLSKLPNTSNSI